MLTIKRYSLFVLFISFYFGCTDLGSDSGKDDAGLGNGGNAQLNAGTPWSSAATPQYTAGSPYSTNQESITGEIKSEEPILIDASKPIEADGCTEQSFYLDNDGDGFGNSDSLMLLCAPLEGYVTQGDDCDDNCASCFPGGTETCGDGKDENCDGSIDEGCPCAPGEEKPCGLDKGECKPGTQSCVEGQWGDCNGASEPTEEVCDNLDNDCDGETDESLSRPCGTDVGACEFGTETCTNGTWNCSGGVTPLTEVCDAQKLDEDCDGSSNEDCACAEGDTLECGIDQGVCKKGTQKCVNGVFSTTCDGEVKADPRGEICDGAGYDDDCDGKTDLGDDDCDCINGAVEGCVEGSYVCSPGTKICANGKWGDCNNVVHGTTESCNGIDDDCDGTTDNASSIWIPVCPYGQTCDNGKCIYCGDGKVNGNEQCDIGATASSSDGLPAGWVYDVFSCDPSTCQRRYLWTPCSRGCGGGSCDALGNGYWCRPNVECSEINSVCYMDGGIKGFCNKYYDCMPVCTSSNDCPQHVQCYDTKNDAYPNARYYCYVSDQPL